ncbi:G-protein coupled receptor Mth2-like isoform X2 [Sitodiplosis mosellana]|nr:G-protein coupled receptor Mth2-like isoform X2 [Sitodiplosis mosellana]XP_055296032.1 G-protein coupled receptor Mth2-like isoform X2 [Sitodiplosis mosellana]
MKGGVQLIRNTISVWIIVLIVLTCINWSTALKTLPCDFFDSNNITSGIRQSDDSIFFDGVIYPEDQYATVDYVLNKGRSTDAKPHIRGCICNIQSCLRLCCPLGSIHNMENGTMVCREHEAAKNFEGEVLHANNETDVVTLDDHFAYVHGHPCKKMYMEDDYQIVHNGDILINNDTLSSQKYCFHGKYNKATDKVDLKLLICLEVPESHPRYAILATCMLISVLFIIATLLVYAFVPKLQNLQGKCLICYLICLAIGYTLMAYIQLNGFNYVQPHICHPIGFTMLFGFLSAFCWLNVLNFDFWLNFQSNIRFKQFNERKQFGIYALYGFGIPFLLTFLVFVLDNIKTLPLILRPGIGDRNCFLTNIFWYFYVPIGIFFIINIVFFVLIALQIRQLQRELAIRRSQEGTPQRQRSLQNKREKFTLFLRLFFVMGISWCMEVVSYLIDSNSPYFLLTDICNTLQGVFIFILFVCNRRVLRFIKERWLSLRNQSVPNEENASNSASASYVRLNQMTSVK